MFIYLTENKSTFKMIRCPTLGVISGTTSSGKTTILLKMLQQREHIFDKPIERVLFCYKVWQPIYEKFRELFEQRIDFKIGLPVQEDIDFLTEGGHHSLLITDDMCKEVGGSDLITSIYQVQSHHKLMSYVNISHNLFTKAKYSRDQSLCVHFILVMRSPRDSSQLLYMGKQCFPEYSKAIVHAYNMQMENTECSHPYLLINLSPGTDRRHTLLANIFEGELLTCYVVNS